MTLIPMIDSGSCVAQGDCMELAPQVFQVGDRASVIGVGADELLLEAARACPVQAITLHREPGGEQVYP